jgi:hypothetical protein
VICRIDFAGDAPDTMCLADFRFSLWETIHADDPVAGPARAVPSSVPRHFENPF